MNETSGGIRLPKLPLLSEEETRRLLSRAKAGDLEARNTLVERNLRLVMSLAVRFAQKGKDLEEVFQAGCIGLMKAIDGFDLSRNVKFSTYAVPVILGEIKRMLCSDELVAVSRPLKELGAKVARLLEEAYSGGEMPSVEEVSERLGVPREEVVLAMEARERPAFFSELVYEEDEDGVTLGARIGQEDEAFEARLHHLALKQALSRLPPRLERVINLRYLKGKTQEEVARIVGLSQAQISRLERQALKCLREEL